MDILPLRDIPKSFLNAEQTNADTPFSSNCDSLTECKVLLELADQGIMEAEEGSSVIYGSVAWLEEMDILPEVTTRIPLLPPPHPGPGYPPPSLAESLLVSLSTMNTAAIICYSVITACKNSRWDPSEHEAETEDCTILFRCLSLRDDKERGKAAVTKEI